MNNDKKLVEWQKIRETVTSDFDSDLNTAANQVLRMNMLAREILTDQQFRVYDEVLTKNQTFSKVAKKLEISIPRVSELWHNAVDKVEKEWALRTSK